MDEFETLHTSLLRIYKKCVRSKPKIKKTLFHKNANQEIFQLCLDLYNRTYVPKKSSIFVVKHPKPREIIAAHLRDRLVHHLIYEYMDPYWEKRFVQQSYACRPGKGPIQAQRDLTAFFKKHQKSYGNQTLYYLKVDVAGFFPSINLNILHQILLKKLQNPFYRWLVTVNVFHRPTENYILKSPKAMWNSIPSQKSMFQLPAHKGLPIGNLTSQFFANVYMNEIDQQLNRRWGEGILHWQRYVDDFLFFSHDRMGLRKLVGQVDAFLQGRLDMQLNPKKTILQPIRHGVDHLGFFRKGRAIYVRRSVVHQARKKIRQEITRGFVCEKSFLSLVNSYLGHFSHSHSFRLRQLILNEICQKPFCRFLFHKKYSDGFLTIKNNIDPFESALQKECYLLGGKKYLGKKWHPLRNWINLTQIFLS